MKPLTRRDFLKVGGLAIVGTAGGAFLAQQKTLAAKEGMTHGSAVIQMQGHDGGLVPGTAGEVDHIKNGFNPTDILTEFDFGKVSTLPNGQTLREYDIVAINKDIEIVPGIMFPAWTYNGRIPGPTLRSTEGDRVRIRLTNGSDHPHTMHFHGFHPAEMDGVPGTGPGGSVAAGRVSSPTSSTPNPLVCISITAMSSRWRVTLPRDSTAHSSLTPSRAVRRLTTKWSWS